MASLLSGKAEEEFRNAIFDGLWQEQKDIADPAVLRDALSRAGGDLTILEQASDPRIREALTRQTAEAYANGVFGTPTFVHNGEIFFGADRLDVLAWKVNRAAVER